MQTELSQGTGTWPFQELVESYIPPSQKNVCAYTQNTQFQEVNGPKVKNLCSKLYSFVTHPVR